MNLTEQKASTLKLEPGQTDRIEFDDAIPGFGIRLREGGSRTWIFQYKFGDKHRRIKLGGPELSRDKAHACAGREGQTCCGSGSLLAGGYCGGASCDSLGATVIRTD